MTSLVEFILTTAFGAALGFILQEASGRLQRGRAGESAARVIYAELQRNFAAVDALLAGGLWTELTSAPRRSAWESHAGELLMTVEPNEIGTVPIAYSSLDDLLYLYRDGQFDVNDDSDYSITVKRYVDVRAALAALARWSGWSPEEVTDRDLVPRALAALEQRRSE